MSCLSSVCLFVLFCSCVHLFMIRLSIHPSVFLFHMCFFYGLQANALFANFQPWQLAKGVGDYAPQKLAFCNRLVLESLVAGGIVLNCIVPTPMGDVLSSLGVEEESRNLGRIRM